MISMLVLRKLRGEESDHNVDFYFFAYLSETKYAAHLWMVLTRIFYLLPITRHG